jgi:hypothetical protein
LNKDVPSPPLWLQLREEEPFMFPAFPICVTLAPDRSLAIDIPFSSNPAANSFCLAWPSEYPRSLIQSLDYITTTPEQNLSPIIPAGRSYFICRPHSSPPCHGGRPLSWRGKPIRQGARIPAELNWPRTVAAAREARAASGYRQKKFLP